MNDWYRWSRMMIIVGHLAVIILILTGPSLSIPLLRVSTDPTLHQILILLCGVVIIAGSALHPDTRQTRLDEYRD